MYQNKVIHRRYPQGRNVVDNPFRHAAFALKVIHTIDTCGTLSNAPRATRAAQAVGGLLLGMLCLCLAASPAGADELTNKPTFKDYLKLYAHNRIVDESQYKCFNTIIHMESRWSYKARNGSHYGLGQMRSRWYGSLNPYQQIDVSLRYIAKRYGSSCNALAYHHKHGWY